MLHAVAREPHFGIVIGIGCDRGLRLELGAGDESGARDPAREELVDDPGGEDEEDDRGDDVKEFAGQMGAPWGRGGGGFGRLYPFASSEVEMPIEDRKSTRLNSSHSCATRMP